MSEDPIQRFLRLQARARATGEAQHATAMTLATCDADGKPAARMVLLKSVDDEGFVFYTNRESAKAADLAANPRAALVFHWQPLERQVRVEGGVEAVTAEESAHYFATRPRESRLAAWASPQSRPLEDRARVR